MKRWRVPRRVVPAVLLIALVIAGSSVGAVADDGAKPVAESDAPAVVTPGENATATPPRHEEPDLRRDGDLGMLQRWLAGRMGEVYVDCATGMLAREFGVCDLDRQYPDWLGKYVEVARETDSETDDGLAETFERTGQDHRAAANATESFWRTYAAYQSARERGDERVARRHARELRRLAGAVNGSAGDLLRDYTEIEEETQQNFSRAKSAIRELRRNVTSIAERLERDLFVATTLTVRGNATRISFLKPLEVRGRLTTEDKSPIANRTVTVTVASKSYTVRTDGDGRFTVRYRPAVLPVDADRVTVRYVPRPSSRFLPSHGSLPVNVSQVEANVSIQLEPATVEVGEEVSVSGTVRVEGIEAVAVPVRVGIQAIGRQTESTGADGDYQAGIDIPERVATGERTVRVSLSEGRALTGANATTLLVQEADSTVVVRQGVGGESPTASGPERRADSDLVGVVSNPVSALDRVRRAVVQAAANRPAVITDLQDVVLRTERRETTPEGDIISETLAAILDRWELLLLVGLGIIGLVWLVPRSVRARAGSALSRWLPDGVIDALEARRRLPGALGRVGAAVRTVISSLPLDRLTAGKQRVVSVVSDVVRSLATLMAVLTARTDGESSTPSAAEPNPPEPLAGDELSAPDPAPTPLERAREYLIEAGPDAAVELAYAAVREALAESGQPTRPRAATHWEFLGACRQDGLDEAAIDDLTELTEAYERAAYAPVSVPAADGEAALERAERLV